jgi:hypothetical protein
MPLLYGVPEPVVFARTLSASDEVLGKDLYFRGDFAVGPHRDYLLVDQVAAAKQSVEREGLAAPGDLPLHPDWGFGLRDQVKKPDTKSVRDLIGTRVRNRLAVNPRIQETQDVRVFRDANTGALVTTIQALAAGRTAAGRITDLVAATITTGGQRQ